MSGVIEDTDHQNPPPNQDDRVVTATTVIVLEPNELLISRAPDREIDPGHHELRVIGRGRRGKGNMEEQKPKSTKERVTLDPSTTPLAQRRILRRVHGIFQITALEALTRRTLKASAHLQIRTP